MTKPKKPEATPEKVATQEQSIQVVEEKVKGMQAMVEATEVSNDAELSDVANKIKAIKQMGKFVRQEMECYIKPAQEIINNARQRFLPFEKECISAETALKQKAGSYMDNAEKARAEKEAKVAKQYEAGRIKEETAVRKMDAIGDEKKSIDTGTAQLQRKVIKVVEIVDREKIPHEYWVVDEVKVRRVALAGVEIPGVIVKEEKTTAIK